MPVNRGFLAGWTDDDGSGNVGTIWNKATIGQLCDGIDAGSYVGNWTAYTPTWTTWGGTLPVLGNGVLQGQYMKINKMIFFWIYMSIGSTSGPGTGTWLWSLPAGLPLSGGFPFSGRGTALIERGNAQFWNLGIAYGYIQTNDVSLTPGGGVGHAANGSPITLAAGDRFHIGGHYMTP
jgi:hypothetical protein